MLLSHLIIFLKFYYGMWLIQLNNTMHNCIAGVEGVAFHYFCNYIGFAW